MNPFGRREVKRTPEFERIANLPERAAFDGAALAREMTDALRRTDGCHGTTSTGGLLGGVNRAVARPSDWV